MTADLKKGLRATEVTSQTATPAAGKRLLYPKSDGWYEKNSAGIETKVGPSAGGGANSMTTDTAQTVTGVKTFGVGKLMMTDGTLTAEPYSDVNAPSSLDMTEVVAAPTPPPAGKATVHTVDGSSLLLMDAAGVDRTVGQIVPDQTLTTDWNGATTPPVPTTGLKLFVRQRARRLPAFIGPTGQDSRLQPFMGSNKVARIQAANATAVLSVDGMVSAVSGTPVAVSVATTNFFSSITRVRAPTAAAASSAAEIRSATPSWFLSTTPNLGGFHMVIRFGLNLASLGARVFVGMEKTVGAYVATVNPSTTVNQIGFYLDATMSQFSFISSGTVVGTPVALGANFPNTAATYFYEANLYSPSGAGQYVFWELTRLNDGLVASGVVGSAGLTGSTVIPANGLLLAPRAYIGTGALTAAQSIDVQSIYIESDN